MNELKTHITAISHNINTTNSCNEQHLSPPCSAMFCGETLDHGIHVEATRHKPFVATPLKIKLSKPSFTSAFMV